MATTKLARSVAAQHRPATKSTSARVLDLLEPTLDEADNPTGWQVLLDYGGGEIRRAGIAASYSPVPGDVVAVAEYQNTLFVIDRVTGGDTGDLPGTRVGYAFREVLANGNYGSAATLTEALVPDLAMTVVIRTGAAYVFEARTGFSTTSANQWGLFRFRQDSVAGADIGEFFRTPSTVAGNVMQFHDTMQVRNDSGADITALLVLTVTGPPTGTLNLYGGVRAKPFVEARLLGASKLYPHAAQMPLPADF